jgi:hypothetical protein
MEYIDEGYDTLIVRGDYEGDSKAIAEVLNGLSFDQDGAWDPVCTKGISTQTALRSKTQAPLSRAAPGTHPKTGADFPQTKWTSFLMRALCGISTITRSQVWKT